MQTSTGLERQSRIREKTCSGFDQEWLRPISRLEAPADEIRAERMAAPIWVAPWKHGFSETDPATSKRGPSGFEGRLCL
jgi:hypothetical protein